ncbi:MAG: hypothetical protein V7K73_07620 [Nostoc sp.]
MSFINQRFVTSCMGARAVKGRSGCRDWGSDTWGIEILAIDKASLYQKSDRHCTEDVIWN